MTTTTPEATSPLVPDEVLEALAGRVVERVAEKLASAPAGRPLAVPGQRIRLREHAETVLANLTKASRRNYESYIRLLVDGTDALVDGRPFTGFGDRWVDEITLSDLRTAEKYVVARAKIRIDERAATRRQVGRAPRESRAEGARRNAVGAWKRLFADAVGDKRMYKDQNPAAELCRPPKNPWARWALDALALAEVLDVIGSTGDDPELDRLAVEFLVVTGARVDELLKLRVCDIDLEESTVFLLGKHGLDVHQPIPPTFARQLLAFATSRGMTNPLDPVFVKRDVAGRAQSITDRRFDNIFCDRVQTMLPWADKVQVTAHVARHTAVTLVERTAGKAVAQAFARHRERTVTDIYAKATRREVAAAVCRLWGDETHPWEEREPLSAR